MVTQYAFEKPHCVTLFWFWAKFLNRKHALGATQVLGCLGKCFYDAAAWLEIDRAFSTAMMVHRALFPTKSDGLKVRA